MLVQDLGVEIEQLGHLGLVMVVVMVGVSHEPTIPPSCLYGITSCV